MLNLKKQKGSSAIEVFISMLIFVPILIAIPLMGKYADIRHKTLEASRYSVWERTVNAQNSNAWNDGGGSAFKTQEQIFLEAEKRFFGNQKVGMHQSQNTDTEQTSNNLWKNRKGENFLKITDANGAQQSPLTGGLAQTRIADRLGSFTRINADVVDSVANQGLSNVVGGLSNININAGGIIGGCAVPGIDLNNGLDLGERGFATSQISVPVFDYMHRPDGSTKDMVYTENAAILSNAWTAPNDDKYRERLDNLVPAEMVNCLTGAGSLLFGLFSLPGSDGFLYGEIKNSHETVINSPSETLPSELVEYEE